jgi:hypothetical protein
MILVPGATIGILGSGQLGRMLAMAALKLGLRCHIYAPESDAPAYDAASERTVAAFNDEAALARFADAVDVITYEFENVPIGCVEFLEKRKPVRPAGAGRDPGSARRKDLPTRPRPRHRAVSRRPRRRGAGAGIGRNRSPGGAQDPAARL